MPWNVVYISLARQPMWYILHWHAKGAHSIGMHSHIRSGGTLILVHMFLAWGYAPTFLCAMPPGSKRKREVEEDDTGPTQRPQGDRTTEIARQCELPEDNLAEDTPSGHAPADGGDSTTEPSAKRTCWGFPKAHAMFHVRETMVMYGNVAEVSAESTERRHVSLKTMFAKVEPGPRAAVQVLAAEIKREVAVREHWKTSGEGGGPRQSIPQPSAVNASFGQRLQGSGKKFPVWESIVEWKTCINSLCLPASWRYVKRQNSGQAPSTGRLILSLTELFDRHSMWCEQATELQHLPLHMAKFLRDTKPHMIPDDIPAAQDDKLTWQQVQALCALVQPYPTHPNRRGDKDSPHLFVHQAVSIRRPRVPGQVRIARTLAVPRASVTLCTLFRFAN